MSNKIIVVGAYYFTGGAAPAPKPLRIPPSRRLQIDYPFKNSTQSFINRSISSVTNTHITMSLLIGQSPMGFVSGVYWLVFIFPYLSKNGELATTSINWRIVFPIKQQINCKRTKMVEPRRFELLTFSMPLRRSTNWAKTPNGGDHVSDDLQITFRWEVNFQKSKLVELRRIELRFPECKSGVLPLYR